LNAQYLRFFRFFYSIFISITLVFSLPPLLDSLTFRYLSLILVGEPCHHSPSSTASLPSSENGGLSTNLATSLPIVRSVQHLGNLFVAFGELMVRQQIHHHGQHALPGSATRHI
jgi:hypothetical protein